MIEKTAHEVGKKPAWIQRTVNEKVKVSNRDYKIVRSELHLPDSYLTQGTKILSVGEGLSNFAQVLGESYPVDVIPVDPIYALGKRIFSAKREDLDEIFAKSLNGEVNTFDPYDEKGRFSKVLHPKRAVAASVYELPFPDDSQDLLLGHAVLIHIDFDRALPELLRVLKPHGEIRMSGLRLTINPQEEKMFDRVPEVYESYQVSFGKHPGLGDSLDKLASDESLSCYVLVQPHFDAKLERLIPGLRQSPIMIIRKDDSIPKVVDFDYTNSDVPIPKLAEGKMFKLKHKPGKIDSYGQKYFQLIPIDQKL